MNPAFKAKTAIQVTAQGWDKTIGRAEIASLWLLLLLDRYGRRPGDRASVPRLSTLRMVRGLAVDSGGFWVETTLTTPGRFGLVCGRGRMADAVSVVWVTAHTTSKNTTRCRMGTLL